MRWRADLAFAPFGHASAPILGADTEDVLSETLGLSPTEIGRLHDEGVVASAAA